MKTFTATQLNKSPQEVFAAAKEEGTVLIEHDRYDGVFAIVWNRKFTEEEVLKQVSNWDPHPTYSVGDKFFINGEECVVTHTNEREEVLQQVTTHDVINTYLMNHESDIAWGTNDFGDLSTVFESRIGRKAAKP